MMEEDGREEEAEEAKKTSPSFFSLFTLKENGEMTLCYSSYKLSCYKYLLALHFLFVYYF